MPEPSSIDTAPSRPTLSIARATSSPMERSLLAELATWAISCEVVQGWAMFLSSATTASIARSMPRLRSMGFIPAARYFSPSLIMPCASTVAVVVPSPAISLVRDATSRSSCAPMFSNRSSSSIDRATTTPELTICGGPKSRSRITVRPRGPSVAFTASARASTPRRIRSRASCPNRSCLAAIRYLRKHESTSYTVGRSRAKFAPAMTTGCASSMSFDARAAAGFSPTAAPAGLCDV